MRTDKKQHLSASDLDLIVFDFDGVLTDNRVLVFEDGREAVVCNRADGLAFDFLRRCKIPVCIVSTERNPVVVARAKKLGVPVRSGVGNKADCIAEMSREKNLDLTRVLFVGNDLNDLGAMKRVGYPVAVADAHAIIRDIAWRVLVTPGGAGVAREIVENTIRFEGFLSGFDAGGDAREIQQ